MLSFKEFTFVFISTINMPIITVATNISNKWIYETRDKYTGSFDEVINLLTILYLE